MRGNITEATVAKIEDCYFLVRKADSTSIAIADSLVQKMLFPFCFRKCTIRGKKCPGVDQVDKKGVLYHRLDRPVSEECQLVGNSFSIPSESVKVVNAK